MAARARARRCAAVATGTRRPRGERRGDGAVAHRGRRRRHPRWFRGCSTATSVGEAGGGERRGAGPAESGELLGFLALGARARRRDAVGFWPAQAVANHALCGEARARHLHRGHRASVVRLRRAGTRRSRASSASRSSRSRASCRPGWSAAASTATAPPLASGCIDALAEQLVAGADHEGDVLVIVGHDADRVGRHRRATTPVPGYWTIPHTAPGQDARRRAEQRRRAVLQLGRASGSGTPTGRAAPGAVPVWAPYPRGERTPLHDPARRGVLANLDLTHDAAAVRRAALRGVGVRRAPGARDRARAHAVSEPRRIVATGGGHRGRRVGAGRGRRRPHVPVDCVAAPEGGALGSAWLARIAAGLEEPTRDDRGPPVGARRPSVRGRPRMARADGGPVPPVPRPLRIARRPIRARRRA